MKNILIVLFIFVLAFAVRFTFILTTPHEIESDEREYDRLAMSLVESKGYVHADGSPTSHRPPLYPAFLALIYKIFGHDFLIVRLIQAFIGSLTVCFLYLIAYKIFNEKTAILTGVFASFYMAFVACTKLLYTETFFTLILALVAFLIITADKPNIINFCIVGFLCGFLTLLRSAAFFTPFLIIFYLMIKLKKYQLSLIRAASISIIMLLCFISVLLPWIIRNCNAHGRLVFVSTNAGLNFYQGVSWYPGRIFDLDDTDEVMAAANSIQNEAERNDFYIQRAIKIYKTHPRFASKMLLMRFLFFWNIIDWDIIGGNTINYHYIFIFPFAALGTIFAFKDRKEFTFILFMILYFTSFVLVFPGTPRYRMPIDGYIIMLGCYGIYEFINRQRKRSFPVLCTGAYLIFTYLLYRYSLQTKYFIRSLMERLGLW